MKHMLASLALVVTICVSGCGPTPSQGESLVVVPQRKPDAPPVVADAAPTPVAASETAASEALEKLGATIDRDDDGHARLVELTESKVTNDDLQHLSQLPFLEAIEITGGAVDDAGMVHIRGMVKLQRLYLDDIKLTNAGLAALENLAGLKVLSLKNAKIDDEGVQHLQKLSKLEVLNLAGTKITDATLSQLLGLKELYTLVLADTRVSGAGMVHLKPLAKLRVLNIARCAVKAPDLFELVELGDLRMLYVDGCDLDAEKIKELEGRMPKLAIFGDEN